MLVRRNEDIMVPLVASCLVLLATLVGGEHHQPPPPAPSPTPAPDPANPTNPEEASSIYEFGARDLSGQWVKMDKYRGHVCIVVNVASKCGFTEQHYLELVELYERYGDAKGLRILAFPSDQFYQEPGNATVIADFARRKGVRFDMFDKVYVNGDESHPLWKYLKSQKGGLLGAYIKWNFTKFIVDKQGKPVERFGPGTSPKELVPILEKYW